MRANQLPNLQLLGAADNKYKLAKWPAEWLASLGPTSRSRYAAQAVKHLPKDLAGFDAFWVKRRAVMRRELEQLLSA